MAVLVVVSCQVNELTTVKIQKLIPPRTKSQVTGLVLLSASAVQLLKLYLKICLVGAYFVSNMILSIRYCTVCLAFNIKVLKNLPTIGQNFRLEYEQKFSVLLLITIMQQKLQYRQETYSWAEHKVRLIWERRWNENLDLRVQREWNDSNRPSALDVFLTTPHLLRLSLLLCVATINTQILIVFEQLSSVSTTSPKSSMSLATKCDEWKHIPLDM